MNKARQQAHPAAAGDGRELARSHLQVHFWFGEQVTDTFKVFSVFAFAWFAAAFFTAKSYRLFENTEQFGASGKWALALFAGIPLLLVAYVVLRFYWWLSNYISQVSGWGAELKWARWFWFGALVVGTYLYLDPLDNIGRQVARAPVVTQFAEYGIPAFNPMLVAYRLAVAVLVLLLIWNYLRQGLMIAGSWLREAWEFAVSLPQGLAVTLVNFLRPNVCVEYPEYRSEIPEHFRGRHRLTIGAEGQHRCIACRACERICPDRLILVSAVRNPATKKLELTGFLLDNSRCCFCGLCEEVCPTGALKHTLDYEYSCYERRELVLDLFGEYLRDSRALRERPGGVHVG